MNEIIKPLKRKSFIGFILAICINTYSSYRYGPMACLLAGIISLISFYSGIQDGIVIVLKRWYREA